MAEEVIFSHLELLLEDGEDIPIPTANPKYKSRTGFLAEASKIESNLV